MSPNGGHVHIVNQISHGKGAAVHSYNQTSTNGFNSGGGVTTGTRMGQQTVGGFINSQGFNSAQ